MNWLKIIDGVADVAKVVGTVTGNTVVAGIGGVIDQAIDSEHDNKEWLSELSTEKLEVLKKDIDKILEKR